jgi:hypothetical protein
LSGDIHVNLWGPESLKKPNMASSNWYQIGKSMKSVFKGTKSFLLLEGWGFTVRIAWSTLRVDFQSWNQLIDPHYTSLPFWKTSCLLQQANEKFVDVSENLWKRKAGIASLL